MQDDKKLYSYLEKMCDSEHPLLHKIDRYAHLHTVAPRMSSGHLQGQFLNMMVKMLNPQYVLEIGTFTGYSTVAMGLGLTQGSKLISIDNNPETNVAAQGFIEEAGLEQIITLITGDARVEVPKLADGIDLVFIDADKPSYATYYNLVVEKLSQNGVILVDNVLWSGKVLEEKKDKKTQVIHDFNLMITSDTRVEKVILPIRDGITLIRKK